jgi:hypothetical protein
MFITLNLGSRRTMAVGKPETHGERRFWISPLHIFSRRHGPSDGSTESDRDLFPAASAGDPGFFRGSRSTFSALSDPALSGMYVFGMTRYTAISHPC